MRRAIVAAGAVLALAACSSDNGTITGVTPLTAPTDLTYQLLPSGDPDAPEGVELRWAPTTDPNVTNYAVYSSPTVGGTFNLRALTTSPSFEDLGTPDAQYYVTAQASDGSESAASNTITVNDSLQLDSPSGLVAIALNTAVQLSWGSNARTANPSAFNYYRVYSTAYDLDQNACDSTAWVLEGTTVSEDFISSGLPNGQPRCFDVSAISVNGNESVWPTPVAATPRADARNVLLFASQDSVDKSGFSFALPSSGALGQVLAGNRTDIDFRLDRHGDGTLWMVPIRTGTSVVLFSPQAIDDLTSIDLAPTSGYSTDAIQAEPEFGYVWETTLDDGLHFAGLRVTAVGSNYVIFDWSYQSDPGNPMLDVTHARRMGPALP